MRIGTFSYSALQKDILLSDMPLISFLLRLEIVRANLASHKVKAGVICSYAAAATAKVSIKDLVPGLGISTVYPGIESYGLFARMNTVLVQCTLLLLPHACPKILKLSHGSGKACPRKLAVCVIAAAIIFISYQPARRIP